MFLCSVHLKSQSLQFYDKKIAMLRVSRLGELGIDNSEYSAAD
jgi:hypothetical protein